MKDFTREYTEFSLCGLSRDRREAAARGSR